MPDEEVLHALDLLGVEIHWLVTGASFLSLGLIVCPRSGTFVWTATVHILLLLGLPPLSEALQFEGVFFYNLVLCLHVSNRCSSI